MSTHLSEQEIIRREKLSQLQEAGIDPYPAATYPVNAYSIDIKEGFSEETKDQFTHVCVAGRIMSINDKGKVLFIKIQDSKGILQTYVRRDDLYPGEDKAEWDLLVKRGLDLGDFIGIKGFVFTTKTGETTIHVQELTLLTKS
jgi:lysyl-tRNA synthetase class 2